MPRCCSATADTALGRDLAVALAAIAVSTSRLSRLRTPARRTAASPRRAFKRNHWSRLQRPVETAEGPDIAAFTIARLAPGQMPEGPHPDPDPPDRIHRLAATLARSSQRRGRARRAHDRGRRRERSRRAVRPFHRPGGRAVRGGPGRRARPWPRRAAHPGGVRPPVSPSSRSRACPSSAPARSMSRRWRSPRQRCARAASRRAATASAWWRAFPRSSE